MHGPSSPIVAGFATVLAVVSLASLVAVLHPKLRSPAKRATRMAILSWWPIILFWTLPCALGSVVALVCTALVSAAALREYLRMLPADDRHPTLDALTYAAVPLHYAAATTLDFRLFFGVLVAWAAAVLPLARMVLRGPQGFVAASARVLFGLVVCVLALSHVYLIFRLPVDTRPAGPEGIAAFLIVLVLLSDAAQWSAGKLFGKTKIAPVLSPNKTWEGLIGGLVVNAFIGVWLTKLFLPVPLVVGAAAAAMVGLVGFAGDLYVSAIKRDLGVKDSGSSIPGQGGILDRHDSMVLAAPIYAWAAWTLLG
jgi:phosphatidate cytidylyltransferase